MQHNLSLLDALVFSSMMLPPHAPQCTFNSCSSEWSALITSLFQIHIAPPSGLPEVFVACLYLRKLGVSFRQPGPAESIH